MESASSSTLRLTHMAGLSSNYDHDSGRIRFVLDLVQIVPRYALSILKPEDILHSTCFPVFQSL